MIVRHTVGEFDGELAQGAWPVGDRMLTIVRDLELAAPSMKVSSVTSCWRKFAGSRPPSGDWGGFGIGALAGIVFIPFSEAKRRIRYRI